MYHTVKKIITYSATAVVAVSMATIAKPTITSEFAKFKARFEQLRQHNKNQENLLFVVRAQRAVFAPAAQQKDCYQLTLTGLDKRVVYFSDEPKRITGKLSAQEFLTTWRHDSKSNAAPNVAIEALHVNANHINEIDEVATLTSPQYDPQQQQLRFTACPLGQRPLKAYPHLQDVTVFFDDFVPWPP